MKVKEVNDLQFLQQLALLEVRLEQVSERLNALKSKLQPILGPRIPVETTPSKGSWDDFPLVSARLQTVADFVEQIADQLHDLYLRA